MLNGKYRVEGYCKSRKVIVDLAEINGEFEVIAMTPSGLELAIESYKDLDSAIPAYEKMVKYYIKDNKKPLPERYAKLRDDLIQALAVGQRTEQENPEDGGTCNFDSAAICLPRWRENLVKQAAKEAGTSCFSWSAFGDRHFVFSPDTHAQANARSRNAEAMTKALEDMGYDAFNYQQAD